MIGVFSFSGIRRLHSDAFGIDHVAQEQPLSGRAAARKRQVAGRQDAFELLGRVSAASHVDQRADYGAYHVAQETVGAYGEYEHITLAPMLVLVVELRLATEVKSSCRNSDSAARFMHPTSRGT